MRRVVSSTGEAKVFFVCEICHFRKDGLAEDTLWFEAANVREDERFQTVLERASHDPASKTIAIDCPSCGRKFMTMVRIGKAQTTLYVCVCGAKRGYTEAIVAPEGRLQPPQDSPSQPQEVDQAGTSVEKKT